MYSITVCVSEYIFHVWFDTWHVFDLGFVCLNKPKSISLVNRSRRNAFRLYFSNLSEIELHYLMICRCIKYTFTIYKCNNGWNKTVPLYYRYNHHLHYYYCTHIGNNLMAGSVDIVNACWLLWSFDKLYTIVINHQSVTTREGACISMSNQCLM